MTRADSISTDAARAAYPLVALMLVGVGAVLLTLSGRLRLDPERLDPAVELRFEERGAYYGLHADPIESQELLVAETLAGGIAATDIDQDGDIDLLVARGRAWRDPFLRARPSVMLWENVEGGRFVDSTPGSGLDLPVRALGVAVADYDGDGSLDVHLTCVGENHLLRGAGYRFRDVTRHAGIADSPALWSTGAAWFDYDRDGFLDLAVAHLVSSDFVPELDAHSAESSEAPAPWPRGLDIAEPTLWHNLGDGRFARVELPAIGQPALDVLASDVDSDGWSDLVIATLEAGTQWLRNLGDGKFELVVESESGGVATPVESTGLAAWRGGDGALSIASSGLAGSSLRLLRSPLGGTAGMRGAAVTGWAGEEPSLFGVAMGDLDLDGSVEIVVAGGHPRGVIGDRWQSAATTALPWVLDCRGSPCSATPLPGVQQPTSMRGLVLADTDGDGDLDLIAATTEGTPRLLQNQQESGRHWLQVDLVGRAPNTGAIGARVELAAGGLVQVRELGGGGGYLGTPPTRLTFGLGRSVEIERLEVRWPDGSTSVERRVGVDQLVTLRQP